MKPRVFIALATGILGGPGKGLAQFLSYGGMEGCFPLVIDYLRGFEQGETEFVRTIRGTGATVAPLRQTKTFDMGLVDQAVTLIKKHDITILQSHGYKSHVLCWLLSRKTGLPWLAFVHGWTRENLRMRVYTGIEHAMLFLPDEVVAVSESLRSRLLGPVRRRCRVIPNAVSPDELLVDPARDVRRELGIASDAVVAGVVGRLSPEKGQDVFLRALAQARKQDARLVGLLVGGGQEEERLRTLVSELGLDGYCFFSGHVQGMGAWYKAMDIQVMPSFTEGMPNAALEGMLMGLPVIASRVGGVPEVVIDGSTGLLVPAGDEQLLARSMLDLLSSPERLAQLGAAGKARVKSEFDPAVRARRILDVYTELLEKHNANATASTRE